MKSKLISVMLAAAVLCALPAGCGNSSLGAGGGSAAEAQQEENGVEIQIVGEAEPDEGQASESGATSDSAAADASAADASAADPAAAVIAAGPETRAASDYSSTADPADIAAAGAYGTEEDGTAGGATAAAADSTEEDPAATESGTSEEASDVYKTESGMSATAADSYAEDPGMQTEMEDPALSFDGESDLEYNARQILLADESITKEGALGVAAYLWQMGFGRMSGYPIIGQVDGGTVLTVFDEEGLFYNIFLTPEGKIQQVEDVEGNELISLGTRAGELVKPPISGEDVVALLEEWRSHGGHSQVVSAYNQFAGDYGRSRMDSGDQWCSETVSAAYAALGIADKIGGMASNGNTYEHNARSVGAWVSGGGYIPSAGDILITHDDNGDRHTACVVSCDGHTIHTIAGGGSSIHHGSISVGSGRITGFVVPEW